ncbi:MAG: YdcF family protein, partial [Lachnospiraceae bacterium]|nr:YdcF family protein [Lachnospiraceae bacterium]
NRFLLLMMCYLECFFLGTVVMAYLAARQRPHFDKDYIIILGCSIDKKGGLLPLLKGRTNRAIRYAWSQEIATGKPVEYVPSGGKGPDEVMSEGSAIELYLLAHGAESEEVHAEKRSKNTYENFLYSKEIIDELKEDAKVCFATTNYHMFRSGVLARRVGLDAEGIASKTKWYFWPNGFVREFFAILNLQRKEHLLATGTIFAGCLILAALAVIFRLRT